MKSNRFFVSSCILLLFTLFPGCDNSSIPTLPIAPTSEKSVEKENGTGATIINAPKIGTPYVAGTFIKLSAFGYEKHEFFYSGTANSYTNTRPLTSDGKWEVAPAATASYKTRMIVYRPTDPAKFNGTVIVEWFNATSGTDAAAEWVNMHTEMIRRGYAWVGISAQKAGVEGGTLALPTPTGIAVSLTLMNYLRYRSLHHPGDSFSYDMFAQGIRLIKRPGDIDPLGGLKVERIIAAGESQSATRMVTFANAFGKSNDCIDGYFIHSRLGNIPSFEGGSAPLSQAPQASIIMPAVVLIRDDLVRPVMILQTETDLFVLGAYTSRQDDSDTFRLWEVAGAAHADEYLSNSGMFDKGSDISSARIVLTRQPNIIMPKCPDYVNAAPQHHFVANAALHALNNWIANGIVPPTAPRLAVNSACDGFVLDQYGNALGGVRSPYVDVPIARLSGQNSSKQSDGDLCFLMGQTDMLDTDILASLYPSNSIYAQAVTRSAQSAVAQGFLLQEDADLIIGAAAEGPVPLE